MRTYGWPCVGVLAVSISLGISGSPAMEFSIIDAGVPTVLGDGPIVSGDAARLKAALLKIPRDQFGLKRIALNSPGGSVDAALEAGEVIASFGAVTIVPAGAKCASACAAVLFIAGRYHKVLPGGALGLHTCYDSNTSTPNALCNERIALFAVEQGTDYGAVWSSMRATGPDQMIWFNEYLADCYGLNRYPDGEEPKNYKRCVFEIIKKLTEPKYRR